MSTNPYLPLIHRNLPRLLAMYMDDCSHFLHGCGDKRYWGWKLIDFANGTYQGGAFGLAHLYKAGLLPNGMDEDAVVERVIAMIRVLPELIDRRGGLAEALPNEGSFCVTGLVLGDILGAIDVLSDTLGEEKTRSLIDLCAPMAEFLKNQDEYHGTISNHLASNALGMVRWAKMAKDDEAMERAALWIDRIKCHASDEGWMSEYDAADPGYQSWCSSALAQIEMETDRFELKSLLQRSYRFLSAFAMPDGSFANGCGGRMTRFFFSAGAEIMAKYMAEAAYMAEFAQKNAPKNNYVTIDSIDEPNLVPMFNDMVLSAIHYQSREIPKLPVLQTQFFEGAGLLVHKGKKYITTVNVKRGGWMLRIPLEDNSEREFCCDPVGCDDHGKILCAKQGRVVSYLGERLEVRADLLPVQRMMPSPFKFIILRLLSLTVFHSIRGGNWVKQALAKLLLKTTGRPRGFVIRHIDLDTGEVNDEVCGTAFSPLKTTNRFSPSHMASQGYWQVSDDFTS